MELADPSTIERQDESAWVNAETISSMRAWKDCMKKTSDTASFASKSIPCRERTVFSSLSRIHPLWPIFVISPDTSAGFRLRITPNFFPALLFGELI
jgi:hypothetical protein